MFDVFYLVEGQWIEDIGNPFKGPRRKLATMLREGGSKQWKIRRVN